MTRPSKTRPGAAQTQTIAISDFKARCLELLEGVRQRGEEIIVTKRGEAIARVTPARRSSGRLRGSMRHALVIRGDVVSVDWSEDWEAAR